MEKQTINNEDTYIDELEIKSEEVHEIITAMPTWIVRKGTILIFVILCAFVLFSAFIQYPDVVKVNLRINSLNAPKAVFVKETGKIVALLVKDGNAVKQNQPLAFMESTANHSDVLKLHALLTQIGKGSKADMILNNISLKNVNLGELQEAFQNFYQQYLQYASAQNGGYYLNRKKYLEKDLNDIKKIKKQIENQQQIQEKEYANIKQEFEAYKKLYQKGVISIIEYKQQENKYLAARYPLEQSVTTLLNNNSNYASKQKEIIDLEHTIQEEQVKFGQSLNNMITQADAWINQYILRAPVDGKLSYAGIVQENQTVNGGQELFMINPANTDFFGEVYIPQYNMGKVRTGQRALIRMRSFPYEQYGMIRGKVNYISDVAFKDSVFIAKIEFEQFENNDQKQRITLKNGMQADAEIITEESSLLQRFLRNITKVLNNT